MPRTARPDRRTVPARPGATPHATHAAPGANAAHAVYAVRHARFTTVVR